MILSYPFEIFGTQYDQTSLEVLMVPGKHICRDLFRVSHVRCSHDGIPFSVDLYSTTTVSKPQRKCSTGGVTYSNFKACELFTMNAIFLNTIQVNFLS